MNEKKFDVILMDMQMPIMGGLEATRLIRDELKLEVPILAMTANAMESDKEQCRTVGMNGHIAKPIDSDDVYQKLKRYLPINTKVQIQVTKSKSKVIKPNAEMQPVLPVVLN